VTSRIRPATSILVAMTLAVLTSCARIPFEPKPTIVIEWGMYPSEFEGLEIEIDREVVGRLERFGENHRTAFPVRKGTHVVRVLHPELKCKPVKVVADNSTVRYRFMLDIAHGVGRDGRQGSYLILDR